MKIPQSRGKPFSQMRYQCATHIWHRIRKKHVFWAKYAQFWFAPEDTFRVKIRKIVFIERSAKFFCIFLYIQICTQYILAHIFENICHNNLWVQIWIYHKMQKKSADLSIRRFFWFFAWKVSSGANMSQNWGEKIKKQKRFFFKNNIFDAHYFCEFFILLSCGFVTHS